MIRTYYTNIDNITFSELNISKISSERQGRIKKIVPENTKKQCLAAGLLINHLFPDKEVKIGAYGKPYIEDGFEFNLAHSGKYVIISVSSDKAVGCDIEQLREYKYQKLGKIVFHRNETETLNNAENQQETFFDLWTKKEAFLKCTGMGFHLKSKKIDLSQNKHFFTYKDTKLRFKEYMLEDYKIMICSPSSDFAQNLIEINFD